MLGLNSTGEAMVYLADEENPTDVIFESVSRKGKIVLGKILFTERYVVAGYKGKVIHRGTLQECLDKLLLRYNKCFSKEQYRYERKR